MKTIRVIKRNGVYQGVLEDLQPLDLASPPQGDLKRTTYAREIARRASYQLLPIEERERLDQPDSNISARPLVFEGMKRQDCIEATLRVIIERVLARAAKKMDAKELELLSQAIERAWVELGL